MSVRMISRLVEGLVDLLHTQGRELRDQVYRTSLSLILTCVAILLMILAFILGAVAVYWGLRQVMHPAAAMAVMTFLVAGVAAGVGVLALRMYPGREPPEMPEPSKLSPRREGDHPMSSPTFMNAADPSSKPADALTQTLDRTLESVRQHPAMAAGVAFGLGVLVTRCGVGRQVVKMAAIWGARRVVDRILSSRD